MNGGLIGLPGAGSFGQGGSLRKVNGRQGFTSTYYVAPPPGIATINGPATWLGNINSLQTLGRVTGAGFLEFVGMSLTVYPGSATSLRLRLTVDGNVVLDASTTFSGVGFLLAIGSVVAGPFATGTGSVLYPVMQPTKFSSGFLLEGAVSTAIPSTDAQGLLAWQDWQ